MSLQSEQTGRSWLLISKKTLDGLVEVFDLTVALEQHIVSVHKEECGETLHIILHQEIGIHGIIVVNAYPRQGGSLCLPEMLVGIKRNLEYLQSAGVVLVVNIPELHDALCGTFRAEHMEVEQHHAAPHVCQSAHVAAVVAQGNLDDISGVHL